MVKKYRAGGPGQGQAQSKANPASILLRLTLFENGFAVRSKENQRFWLGGLDSNQDTQSQSLVSYQLDDLPADGGTTKTNRSEYPMIGTATIHLY